MTAPRYVESPKTARARALLQAFVLSTNRYALVSGSLVELHADPADESLLDLNRAQADDDQIVTF